MNIIESIGLLLFFCFILFYLKKRRIRKNRVNFILKIIADHLGKQELVKDVVVEGYFCSLLGFNFLGDRFDLFPIIEEKIRLLGFGIFCYKKLSDGVNFEIRYEDEVYNCDIFWSENETYYSIYLG